jgi:hypothetical protein
MKKGGYCQALTPHIGMNFQYVFSGLVSPNFRAISASNALAYLSRSPPSPPHGRDLELK